jgi:signal transduction histidine kinase
MRSGSARARVGRLSQTTGHPGRNSAGGEERRRRARRPQDVEPIRGVQEPRRGPGHARFPVLPNDRATQLPLVRVDDDWLVAGASLAETQHVEALVERVELIAGPVLVLSMFFAALAIGLMTSRPLEQARRRQLEFAADASHELRTPIAVIDAQVALALSSPRDGASYRDTLRRIGKEAKRLRHIVEDLLFLARFDARTAVRGDHAVDLVSLAGAGVLRFASEAAGHNRDGVALGLAIADAVARSTGGKWKVADTPWGGTHMEVFWRRKYGRDGVPALHLGRF